MYDNLTSPHRDRVTDCIIVTLYLQTTAQQKLISRFPGSRKGVVGFLFDYAQGKDKSFIIIMFLGPGMPLL